MGTPNCGKSALIARLTGARVNVAPFPFATALPVPGMLLHEDVQIQLVDLPPVTTDGIVPGMTGALRSADALAVCFDLAADDLLDQAETCFRVLGERGIVRQGQELPEGSTPRPMLLVSATGDWTKNTPTVEFPTILKIYKLYDAGGNLQNAHFDAGHNYNLDSRKAVYRFFSKHLLRREVPSADREPPFTPEPPENLLLFQNRKLAVFANRLFV